MNRLNRILARISIPLVLLAFAGVGWFTGYLAGASSSPVVAVLLPAIFGVFGGLSTVFLNRQWTHSRMQQRLEDLDLSNDHVRRQAAGIVDELFDTDESSSWLPSLYSIAILLFCFMCFWGIESGYQRRVNTLTQPTQPMSRIDWDTFRKHVVGKNGTQSNADSENVASDLKPAEYAKLMSIYLRSLHLGMDEDVFKLVKEQTRIIWCNSESRAERIKDLETYVAKEILDPLEKLGRFQESNEVSLPLLLDQ